MKNWTRWLTAGAACLAFVSASVAENTRGRSSAGTRDNTARSEEVRDRMIERVAERLELDDATTEKLKALLETQQEARKKLGEEMRAETQKLKDLLRNDASDAELNAQIDRIEAKRDAMHAQMVSGAKEVRALLGPEKYARWLSVQQQAMQGMRERFQGGQNARGGRGQGSRRGPSSGGGNWGYN